MVVERWIITLKSTMSNYFKIIYKVSLSETSHFIEKIKNQKKSVRNGIVLTVWQRVVWSLMERGTRDLYPSSTFMVFDFRISSYFALWFRSIPWLSHNHLCDHSFYLIWGHFRIRSDQLILMTLFNRVWFWHTGSDKSEAFIISYTWLDLLTCT